MNIREDGRVEWVCKHGVGHTISVPKEYEYESAWWSHGCDGCCTDIKPITDEKDEEIKDLQTALKGYDKIITEYPTLKKKLEKIQEIIKEYRDDTAIRLIKELLENKK